MCRRRIEEAFYESKGRIMWLCWDYEKGIKAVQALHANRRVCFRNRMANRSGRSFACESKRLFYESKAESKQLYQQSKGKTVFFFFVISLWFEKWKRICLWLCFGLSFSVLYLSLSLATGIRMQLRRIETTCSNRNVKNLSLSLLFCFCVLNYQSLRV